jgi:hypothetical protein
MQCNAADWVVGTTSYCWVLAPPTLPVKYMHPPSVPKYLSLYAFREITLIKYILKNINIYGI